MFIFLDTDFMIFFTYIDLRKFYDFAVAPMIAYNPCLALALHYADIITRAVKKLNAKIFFVVCIVVGKTNAIKTLFLQHCLPYRIVLFSSQRLSSVHGLWCWTKKKKKYQQQIVTLTANRENNLKTTRITRVRERERASKCCKNCWIMSEKFCCCCCC